MENSKNVAEVEAKEVETEKETTEQEQSTDENKSVEEQLKELKDKFNEVLVDNAKLKRQNDKYSSEAADWKKKYRSTQSEKEVLDAEKAEAEAKKDERLAELERKDKIHDLTENFMDLGYSKEDAKKAAAAQFDGDADTLMALQREFTKAQIEAEKQKILSELPQPNIGVPGTNTYTIDDFRSMTMADRSKLKRENEAEYNRLLNLSKTGGK